MKIRLDCTEIEIYALIHTIYSFSRNADVVNIKNLRIKYNNNNNLHGLIWYELIDH